MRLYKTQYSFRISGNRGYDSNRVRLCSSEQANENEGLKINILNDESIIPVLWTNLTILFTRFYY